MARVFRAGVIGAGLIFHNHAQALCTLGERVRLVAVADVDEDRLKKAAQRYSIPFSYTNCAQLLARDDIDLVIVATPPSSHEALVIEALEAGKHVLCEKPIAPTLESADRISQAASRHHTRVTVCYQLRFLPEVQRIVWLRDQGWLGNLEFGSVKLLSRFEGSAPSANSWWGRWDVAGGGVTITKLIHELDLLIHLFGEPREVYAVTATLRQSIESEDTIVATMRFASGAVVACSATLNAHAEAGTVLDIIGSRASAHLPWRLYASDASHHAKMKLALEAAQLAPEATNRGIGSRVARKLWRALDGGNALARLGRRVTRRWAGGGVAIRTAHSRYIEACLDAIDNGREVPVPVLEARRSLELCVAMYASALSGCPVSLPIAESSPYYKGITADVYRERCPVRV